MFVFCIRRVCKVIVKLLVLLFDLDVDYFDSFEMFGKFILILCLLYYEGNLEENYFKYF